MAPVSVEEILAFWENEFHPDEYYGRIKPGDIRLEKTSSWFPEQYDAFDGKGNLIGYLRVDKWSFTVECPVCEGDTVYEAFTLGVGCFEDFERDSYLEKAKRAIAEYYRTRE